MITVFVWNERSDHGQHFWGHASMKVEGGAPPGEVYISWWPVGDGQGKGCRPGQIHTFSEDKADELHGPDHIITIEGLDETAIKRMWSVWQKEATWCKTDRNCATVVAAALKLAGGDDYVSAVDWHDSRNLIWSPHDIVRYAYAVKRGLAWEKTKAKSPRSSTPYWPFYYLAPP